MLFRYLSILTVVGSFSASAQRPIVIAPNAPRDQPATVRQQCEWSALVRAIEPFAREAHSSYPAAKQRFLAGLPPRHVFFVTIRLTDSLDHHEQVFLAVDSIVGRRITGRIASEITTVRGYAYGRPYAVQEADLIDWLIAKPDGSEEGNIVGRFLDNYRPAEGTCKDPDRSI